MISGVGSAVGKSFLTLGLVVALRKKGMSVSCCITGRALHQALVYSRITRRYARVLDRGMLRQDEILAALYQAGIGSDLVIIDGQGGFYDGIAPADFRGSDAEIAAMTQTPVALVVPVPEVSNSISALVRGFSQFTQENLVSALVANRIHVPEHQDPFAPNPVMSYLEACMRGYNLPSFVGGLPTATFPVHVPPSSISQQENCTLLPMQFFLDAGSFVANHLDLDYLLDIARSAPQIETPEPVDDPRSRLTRFAVTDDSCFNVCYQDNLHLLRHSGAEISTFSPLADLELPKRIGGLYITGAYLRPYGEELARNESMRRAIKAFADAGGVVYSEGAGTAYLCRTFQIDPGGPVYPGVGLIPADAVGLQQPQAMLDVVLMDESILGRIDRKVQGVTLGDWGIRAEGAGSMHQLVHVFKVTLDDGSVMNEGYSATAQSVGTFHFLNFTSYPNVARSLVDAATVFDKSRAAEMQGP
jgi:cobyrinic acid a,c-diamide synthase